MAKNVSGLFGSQPERRNPYEGFISSMIPQTQNAISSYTSNVLPLAQKGVSEVTRGTPEEQQLWDLLSSREMNALTPRYSGAGILTSGPGLTGMRDAMEALGLQYNAQREGLFQNALKNFGTMSAEPAFMNEDLIKTLIGGQYTQPAVPGMLSTLFGGGGGIGAGLGGLGSLFSSGPSGGGGMDFGAGSSGLGLGFGYGSTPNLPMMLPTVMGMM